MTTFVAAMLYVLIPGPATLAALSLSATDGRAACIRFLGCHLVGDKLTDCVGKHLLLFGKCKIHKPPPRMA